MGCSHIMYVDGVVVDTVCVASNSVSSLVMPKKCLSLLYSTSYIILYTREKMLFEYSVFACKSAHLSH